MYPVHCPTTILIYKYLNYSWHASCALSGKRILIHGGYDGNLAMDDTHILSLGKLNTFNGDLNSHFKYGSTQNISWSQFLLLVLSDIIVLFA